MNFCGFCLGLVLVLLGWFCLVLLGLMGNCGPGFCFGFVGFGFVSFGFKLFGSIGTCGFCLGLVRSGLQPS